MRAVHVSRTVQLATVGLVLLGCEPMADGPARLLAPDAAPSDAALAEDRCENFEYSTVGALGIHFGVGTEPWHGRLGAQPTPVTIAGLDGLLFSWVDAFHYAGAPSGKPAHGAEHLTLHHRFETSDGIGGWFQTDDEAVCSPSGVDSGCVVHDQMRVVDGAGIFANADGWIKNQGQITFGASGTPVDGTLELNLRGRVCGDGIG